MLEPILKLRDPQEPLQTVRRNGRLEVGHVAELHINERFPRSHHAFPSLNELLSFTTYPVMLDPELGGEDTGIKVRIGGMMLRDKITHEKNHFHFEIGNNCVLSMNVAWIPYQMIREGKSTKIDFICDEIPITTWKGDKNLELFKRVFNEVFVRNLELEFVRDASLLHRFAAGNLEELISIERDKEWKAEIPCMKVTFHPALVVR
jgi:hypothetical protein